MKSGLSSVLHQNKHQSRSNGPVDPTNPTSTAIPPINSSIRSSTSAIPVPTLDVSVQVMLTNTTLLHVWLKAKENGNVSAGEGASFVNISMGEYSLSEESLKICSPPSFTRTLRRRMVSFGQFSAQRKPAGLNLASCTRIRWASCNLLGPALTQKSPISMPMSRKRQIRRKGGRGQAMRTIKWRIICRSKLREFGRHMFPSRQSKNRNCPRVSIFDRHLAG